MFAALVAVLAVAAAVAFTVIAYRRDWRWTGLPADPGDGTPAAPPRPAKTLWDWLQLLIVPLVLALAAFGLNAAQVDRDRRQEERRAEQERKLEARRAARDRASAEDRAREETLRTYLQQMSDLMTRPGRATADTQTLAQTLTLVALRRLDGARKGLVVEFLIEADLIETAAAPPAPVASPGCGAPGQHACRRIGVSVSLENADLREAIMPPSLSSEVGGAVVALGPGGRPLPRAAAAAVSFVGWFDGADLRNADFRGRALMGVTFDGADLRGATFSGASLDGTSFSGACVSGARFDRVEVGHRADFSGTEGRGVDFSNARLAQATFAHARLTDVRLSGASTTGVRWPRDWTPAGLRMSDAEARGLCSGREE